MKVRNTLATLAITAAVSATVRGDVVFGDFESGTIPTGFGALTNSGVQPWASPVSGAVTTATSSSLAGSKVLDLMGTAAFNFGQGSGAALGFDFLSANLRSAFFANDQLEFDWVAVPNDSPMGYSQLYNVVLNSQGGGYTNVAGYSTGDANYNQYYYTGYNGITHHIVVNYTTYKNAVLASGNPDGGGWIQLGIQPNAGGGAPGEMYFDNFKLTSSGPTNAQWNVDADGNWSVASNWTPSAPNAAGAVATFGPIIMAPRTVTVDSAQTTGQVNFNNANKYTIAGGSALTLDNTSGGVGVTVTAGSHDISAPLVLAKDATMTVTPAGSTLKITNLQTSTVNITIGGAGTSAFNTVRANSLTVNSGVAAIIPGRSSNSTSKITSLTIAGGAAPTARLDMGDNDLAVDYSGSSPLSTIAAQIKSGYNSGAWNGNGISSVAAAATASSAHSTALGYGESSAVLGPSGGTFSGQNVDGTAVLVRYTYSGDANLDGSVDTVDFNLLAASFSQSNKSWSNGDFNYDGSVDTVDFNLLASNFAQPTIAAPALVGGLVPEPASMTTLGWALGALLLTRRRRARC